MKKLLKTEYLPRLFASLGVAGCILRMSLYHFGLDEKGLLNPVHPLGIALVVLTLGAAAAADLLSRRAPSRTLVLPGWAFALSSWLLAGAVFSAGLGPDRTGLLGRAVFVAGLLAGAGLLWAGGNALRQRKPHFLSHFFLSLFFALLLVANYPSWSGDPQMMDYLWFAFALIGLAWRAFDLAAREVGLPAGKLAGARGFLAVFFCFAGADWGHMLLLLAGGVWAEVNLYRMDAEEE